MQQCSRKIKKTFFGLRIIPGTLGRVLNTILFLPSGCSHCTFVRTSYKFLLPYQGFAALGHQIIALPKAPSLHSVNQMWKTKYIISKIKPTVLTKYRGNYNFRKKKKPLFQANQTPSATSLKYYSSMSRISQIRLQRVRQSRAGRLPFPLKKGKEPALPWEPALTTTKRRTKNKKKFSRKSHRPVHDLCRCLYFLTRYINRFCLPINYLELSHKN